MKDRCERRHFKNRPTMSDFLNRQASPLSDEQWNSFENAIISSPREQIVGRRFVPLVGPLGPGIQQINIYTFADRFEEMVMPRIKKPRPYAFLNRKNARNNQQESL